MQAGAKTSKAKRRENANQTEQEKRVRAELDGGATTGRFGDQGRASNSNIKRETPVQVEGAKSCNKNSKRF